MAAAINDIRTNISQLEYNKFVELSAANSIFQPISVVRWTYPDGRLNALPISSVDIYPKYAVLSYIANPEEINVNNFAVSAEEFTVYFDELESCLAVLTAYKYADIDGQVRTNTLFDVATAQFELSNFILNTRLDILTSVDYSTSANQVRTNTILEVLTGNNFTSTERTNTLLNTLTAINEDISENTDGIETRLDELTSVNFATSANQVRTNTILDTLSSQHSTTNALLNVLSSSQDRANALIDTLTASGLDVDLNTDGLESRLDVLTAVDFATSANQDREINILESLTAIALKIEHNTDGVESKLDHLTGGDDRSNSLLNTLTSVLADTNLLLDTLTGNSLSANDRNNSLLDTLTSIANNIDLNTDGLENRLDVLTAVDFATSANQIRSNTLTEVLTSDSLLINTQLYTLTSNFESLLQKSDTVISLANTLTSFNSEIKNTVYSISARADVITDVLFPRTNNLLDTISATSYTQVLYLDRANSLLETLTATAERIDLNTDGLEARLDVLTAVDYSTATNQVRTNTILETLTSDNVLNYQRTNSLLETLTATGIQVDLNTDGLESRLDVLTAVDYSTATNQVKTNEILDALSATCDLIRIDADALTNVDYATTAKQDIIISLLQSLSTVNRVNGFVIPDYNRIKNYYYTPSKNLSQVDYIKNTTVVGSLSFWYVGSNTDTDALLEEVIKIL
jgi:hypothetical protein